MWGRTGARLASAAFVVMSSGCSAVVGSSGPMPATTSDTTTSTTVVSDAWVESETVRVKYDQWATASWPVMASYGVSATESMVGGGDLGYVEFRRDYALQNPNSTDTPMGALCWAYHELYRTIDMRSIRHMVDSVIRYSIAAASDVITLDDLKEAGYTGTEGSLTEIGPGRELTKAALVLAISMENPEDGLQVENTKIFEVMDEHGGSGTEWSDALDRVAAAEVVAATKAGEGLPTGAQTYADNLFALTTDLSVVDSPDFDTYTERFSGLDGFDAFVGEAKKSSGCERSYLPDPTHTPAEYDRQAIPSTTTTMITSTTVVNLPPVFPQSEYTFTMPENQGHGWQTPEDEKLIATDTDGDDAKITYILYGGNSSCEGCGGTVTGPYQDRLWRLDGSGRITYQGSGEDYEALPSDPPSYKLWIKATDEGGSRTTLSIKILIGDVDESGDSSTTTSTTTVTSSTTTSTTTAPATTSTSSTTTVPATTTTSAVAAVVPGAPLNVKLSGSFVAERTRLGVVWDEPGDDGGSVVVDYDLRYCDTATSCDEVTDWVEWMPDAADSINRSVIVDGLSPDTEYQFQVRAANSVGGGPWSAAVTGHTVANRPPVIDGGSVLNLKVSRTLPGGEVVHTFGATDPDGDPITWRVGGSGDGSYIIDAGTGQLRANPDDPHTVGSYIFRVYATDSYEDTDSILISIRLID